MTFQSSATSSRDNEFNVSNCDYFNSGGFDYSLKLVNFKLISTIDMLSIFCEIANRWIPQHLTDH